MELSKRLEAVAAMLGKTEAAADIGTDHGYIPIHLIKNGIVSRAIAMDINKGPLKRAREHIESHDLDAYIETRLSDGAKGLAPGEVQALILSGMGGFLMIKIMEESKVVFSSAEEIILQPQSDIEEVRRYLIGHSFCITGENMIVDNNKFYTVIKAVPGSCSYDQEIYFRYGKLLLEEKNKNMKEYLKRQLIALDKIGNNIEGYQGTHIKKRRQEIWAEKNYIKQALAYYQQ